MELAIEKHEKLGARRVKAVPSVKGGAFIVEHHHYGRRIVESVGIPNVDESVIDKVESGEVKAEDFFDADTQREGFHLIKESVVIASVGVPGSGNSVSVSFTEVQEVAPYTTNQ